VGIFNAYKKLNLGCGSKHKQGYVNIDIQAPADLVADVTKGLPFKDGEAERAEADNLLEHLDNDEFRFVMNEIWRVLTVDGIFWLKVPDALHWMDGAFGDPTHKRFFVPRSFKYFTEGTTYDDYGKTYGFKPWKIVTLVTDAKFFTCELTPKK
jgi:SAM-dependent methyltransferase